MSRWEKHKAERREKASIPAKDNINDYDPYAHRIIAQPMSNCEAFICIVKCALGTGCLAMPMAFFNSGWLNGLIGTFVIGFTLVYALHLLLRGTYELCKKNRVPYLTYSEAMTIALKEGPPCMQFLHYGAGPCIDIFLVLYHFGVCCVYVVFIADNIEQVGDYYFYYKIDKRFYMCILILPLAAIYLIRDIKHLVPFSAVANLLISIGLGMVFYCISQKLPPLSDRHAFEEFKYYPLFFGTVLFSIESVGVLVSIEGHMSRPQDFLGITGILNLGIFIVLIIYAAFGFIGYWHYGTCVQGSITLNLPKKDILSQCIKIMFAIAIYFTYALQGYVTMQVSWSYYSKTVDDSTRPTLECIMRICIVLATVLCAIISPNFATILALVGSSCLSFLGLVFPGLFDLCMKYHVGYGPLYIYFLQDIFIMLFGFFGGVMGTWAAMNDLIADIKMEQNI